MSFHHPIRVPAPPSTRASQRLPVNRRLPLIYRLGLEWDQPAAANPLARDAALARLEAVLFAAEEPLPMRKLVDAAGLADVATGRRLLRALQDLYDRDGSPFQIDELAGGFQLLTRAEY